MKNFFHKHERLITILTPIILGIVYIILCAVDLKQSIWFDESYGAYLTRSSFGDIWNLTAVDVHPPLYYFVLKLWSMLFGYTDFGMRFMSIFFGAIAIVFAWQWLKRKFGLKPAMLATLLMTVSPMFIRYGQEMRMYTMAAAIIFAATYVMQLAIDTKQRKYWIIYGVLLALGMWTHYFVGLIWLAHLAYLIYVYRKKIFQKNIIISYATGVLLYLPWLPSFIEQTSTVQKGFWIGAPSATTVVSYFTNALVYQDSGKIVEWLLPAVIIAAVCYVFVLRKAGRRIMPLLFMSILPVALLVIFSMPPLKPMFVSRYVIYSAICLSLAAGIGVMIVKFKHKFTPIIMAAVFLGTSIIGIVNVYVRPNSNSDAKALYESISAISAPGTPIISETEWLYYDLSFYGTEEHPVYFIDEIVSYEWGSHEPLRTNDYGKILDLDEFLSEHETVWFVGDLPEEDDLEFPRDYVMQAQVMILDVNNGNAPYQAIEFTRIED